MPYSAAIAQIGKATESAQQAADLLAERTRQLDAPDLHLPIEDLKIAIRFLELARGGLIVPAPIP